MTATIPTSRLDGPIRLFFGLSYSNYLVLHRSMMQSMPVEWQQRAVAVFDELHAAFRNVEQADSYIVTPADERTYSDLSEPDDAYYDRDGNQHGPHDRVLAPLGDDPVPHYDRGRTFIEST